jgi:TonB family protein
MASAPRQASHTSSSAASGSSSTSLDRDATVEESVEDNNNLISLLRDTVSTGTQPVEAVFTSVADAARVMSGADGTALAVETNGIIVCQARSGDIAPPLGAPISTESGISGECLRAAAMLVCYDTLCDPRVDAEVCSALGIRSIVAVPLMNGSHRAGILEAFSSRPDAFDGEALNSLRALAEIALMAHCRPNRAASSLETTQVSDPTPTPKPLTPPTPPVQSAVNYIPRTFTSEEITSLAGQAHRIRIWRIAAIAIAILLITAVAWWGWHGPDESVGSTQTAHAAATATDTEKPNTRPLSLQVLPKPAPGISGKHSAQRADIILENASDVQPVEEHREEAAAASPSGTSAPTSRTRTSEVPVMEPPAVEMSPSASPEQLQRLTTVQPQLPSGGPMVSQGVVEASLIHRVDPQYPMQARTQRLSGKVILSATIAADGTVRQVAILGGSPLLAAAAAKAVRQWRYHPATLNGSAIEVQKELTFVFNQP